MIESRLPHQNRTKHNDAQNFCSFTIIHSISTVNAEDSCNSCLRISEGRQRFVSRFFFVKVIIILELNPSRFLLTKPPFWAAAPEGTGGDEVL